MPVFCQAQTSLALAILGEDADGGHPWTHKNGPNGGEGAQYQRLVHHCNTTSPEDFTPPGDTEPRLSVSGCQAFVKNVLQWNLENLKKLKAVGVESGGGTVAEEDLTLSPEELEDLEQCCGDGTSEWYIAGETADAYREIFVAYKKWQAKATGAKEAAAQEKEQGANEARDQREQATRPGRQPSSPGTPAQGTPQGIPGSAVTYMLSPALLAVTLATDRSDSMTDGLGKRKRITDDIDDIIIAAAYMDRCDKRLRTNHVFEYEPRS